ncbi:hypothetical protein NFI96_010894 [Prochilodus magdalenae]|nr:hypothetical protein NFI96_010894 [Prochilodus magdalenae]
MSPVPDQLLDTLQGLGKIDLKWFKWNLSQGVGGVPAIPKSQLEDADIFDTVSVMLEKYGHGAAVDITLTILKKIRQNELAEELRSKVQPGVSGSSPAPPGGLASPPASIKDANRQAESQKLKSKFRQTFTTLYEGMSVKGHVLLNDVYTELHAVEGWSGGVSTEHEIIHIESESWRCSTDDTPIQFSSLFQSESKVLTIGIAGIGKTVAIQKFVLDWADGKSNRDMDFVFLIPFRELNLIKDDEYSFQQLLLYFHPELNLKETGIFDDECRSLFIFDGLDEFRVPLNFKQKRLSGVTEKAKVDVLLCNFIMGHLLPSALVWITSRPATADQIPLENINLVTELRGFSDEQKDVYFARTLRDEHLARRISSHAKKSKSLHIMCHIPVFCWMMAAVLQRPVRGKPNRAIPRTLTEMYTNFLLIQANMKSRKYDESHEKDTRKLLQANRDVILRLAELAFKQLVEGKVIFYEEDLKECGINVSEPSMYFGLCSEFFLEESILYQRKVYCFVHLSFQEFLAAYYVFYCYVSKNMGPLQILKKQKWSEEVPLHELLMRIVEINLWRQSGHLDLFLRFLVGISLVSNQKLLQGLLTRVEHSAESITRTAQFIKDRIQTEDLPADKSTNLLLCLLEMNDQSLNSEIQEFLKSAKPSQRKLSTAYCSAIAHMLQMSENVLDELDLKKYNTSPEGCMRLIPAVGNCRKALLPSCSLTVRSCECLASVIQKVNSTLRELDLTNNDIQDSGVKLLSAGLENPHCKLETLRLSGCMITEKGCSSLASALSSNSSDLKNLDLSYNSPGELGVQLLRQLKDDPHCKLEELNVDHGGEFRIKPGLKKYAFDLTLDVDTANSQLSLSQEDRSVSWTKGPQEGPDHSGRSDQFRQVLCGESMSGRQYWEVEWSESVAVAVTYKGIHSGAESLCSSFGHDGKSWSLYCTQNSYTAWHDDHSADVPASSSLSGRVGVYLDWLNGTLSFYSISSNLTPNHLYTFHCGFSEPVYAGFGVGYGSSITLVDV